MTFSHLNRAWALATAFVGIACLPAAADPVDITCSTPRGVVDCVEINDVFEFKGTVTDIGVQRGPGQIGGIEYRIDGKFDYNRPLDLLDLNKSTVTFHNFFDESHGNGEMVLTTDNADLVCPDDPLPDDKLRPGGCVPTLAPLSASKSSKPTEAKYETPARFRPQMRVQIENTNGEYEFNVRLDRGLSPQVPPLKSAQFLPEGKGQFPQLCAVDPTTKSTRRTTKIRIRFTIDDGVNKPVVLDFVKDWECDKDGRYHLRSR